MTGRTFQFVIAILALLAAGCRPDSGANAPEGATVVAVALVDREDLYNQLTIAAEFRPFAEVELHAKVSGYLEKITVDFGDKVKAGQLLAVLEVPELKDELESSRAAESRAEADYTNSHLAFTRLQDVNRQHANLVAQQDIDTAQAKDSVAVAALSAAKADVEKFQSLYDYAHITAPFAGVITHRYADPGALIQAGTSSDQAKPVLRLSDNYRLRLDFPVSVDYVQFIKVGDAVEVHVESLGGKTFSGVVSRFSGEVNAETRTMTTEIEVPNPSLALVPGMYAKATLKTEKRSHVLTVPTEAVSVGKKNTVFVVNTNNEIEERTVTLGLETPARYEVTGGLQEGDRVLVGSRGQVRPGQKVEPKLIPAAPANS